jgi:hypothetical protein
MVFKKGHKHTKAWYKAVKGKERPKHVKEAVSKAQKGRKHQPQEGFQKGHEVCEGSEKGWFKKGHKPKHAGKERKEMQWDKHPNFTTGWRTYQKFIKRLGLKPICEECKKEESEFGRKMHIHHKDKNRDNNKKDNLQILCVSCHMKLHKGKKNNI